MAESRSRIVRLKRGRRYRILIELHRDKLPELGIGAVWWAEPLPGQKVTGRTQEELRARVRELLVSEVPGLGIIDRKLVASFEEFFIQVP